MGSFYDSIHVRTESYDLIKNVLTELSKNGEYKFYLAPVINGWVGLFPNKYGDEILAPEISKQSRSDVLRLLVHDDDVFCYLYYRSGQLVDEYNSRPDYFGEKISVSERKRLKGKPEVFKELLDSENEIAKIRKILKPRSFLKNIRLPDELKEMNKKLKSFSKELHTFVSSPNAMEEYLQKNPDILSEHCKSVAKQLKSKGITSAEDVQKYLEESDKAEKGALKLVETFVNSRIKSKEYDFFDPNSDKAKKISAAMEQMSRQLAMNDKNNTGISKDLFANKSMCQFAEILGIANSFTSYEYLKNGDIDNIKEWDKFVEIPL